MASLLGFLLGAAGVGLFCCTLELGGGPPVANACLPALGAWAVVGALTGLCHNLPGSPVTSSS